MESCITPPGESAQLKKFPERLSAMLGQGQLEAVVILDNELSQFWPVDKQNMMQQRFECVSSFEAS